MTTEELNESRLRLGLTIDQMWRVLGCKSRSTYTCWFTRDKVPKWAGYSAENLELLSKRTISKMIRLREDNDGEYSDIGQRNGRHAKPYDKKGIG